MIGIFAKFCIRVSLGLGAIYFSVAPVSAKSVEDKDARNSLLFIYSYANFCSEAHAYIETDGFRKDGIKIEDYPELLFWTKLAGNSASGLKLNPSDMGKISGFSIVSREKVLGYDRMMSDMRIIAADCEKQKPKYELGLSIFKPY